MPALRLGILLAATCAMSAATMVQAQPPSYLGVKRDAVGSGRVVVNGLSSDNLRRAEVDLRTGGSATLRFTGSRSWVIQGRWRRISETEHRVTIETAFGDRGGSGEGTVYLERGGALRSIDVSGRTQNRPFTLNFDARDDGGSGGNWDTVNVSAAGSGIVRRGRDLPVSLRSASVNLSRNRQAVIRLNGQRSFTFTGTWNRRDRDTVRVELTSGFGTTRITATGIVELERNGRGLRSIELSGSSSGGARFSANFEAGDVGPIPGPFPGLNQSSLGTGTFTIRDNREPLSEIRLWLKPGGDAEIILYQRNGNDRRLTGSWHTLDRDSVGININGGLRPPTNGRATVHLRNQRVLDRIEGSGSSDRGSFSFNFRAQN